MKGYLKWLSNILRLSICDKNPTVKEENGNFLASSELTSKGGKREITFPQSVTICFRRQRKKKMPSYYLDRESRFLVFRRIRKRERDRRLALLAKSEAMKSEFMAPQS